MGWFLLTRFVDLVRVYSLLIISKKLFQHIFIAWPAEMSILLCAKKLLAKFLWHPVYRAPPDDCFWNSYSLFLQCFLFLWINQFCSLADVLSRTLTFHKVFVKLKFSPDMFEKIPSFICLVFKNETGGF